MTFRRKNGTQTVATMQSVRQMKNDIIHAKCMAEALGHMLQDIKNKYPNKYPAVMRTVKSWKNYSFIGFTPTMREEIDNVWIGPNTWNDGKKAAMAFVPLFEVFMKHGKR